MPPPDHRIRRPRPLFSRLKSFYHGPGLPIALAIWGLFLLDFCLTTKSGGS